MLINSSIVTLYHRLGLKALLSEVCPEVKKKKKTKITIRITYSEGI